MVKTDSILFQNDKKVHHYSMSQNLHLASFFPLSTSACRQKIAHYLIYLDNQIIISIAIMKLAVLASLIAAASAFAPAQQAARSTSLNGTSSSTIPIFVTT
jgi:signal-transduction protein with cAMP-binding, CBS, and nucleotidyltransferase domain